MGLPSSTIGRVVLFLIVVLLFLPIAGFSAYITLLLAVPLVIAFVIRYYYQQQSKSSSN